MHYAFLALLFFLSGFFMKFSDDEYDVNNNKTLAVILGILCTITCAMATVSSVGAAYIFIAILIGNLLAFKVDGIHHAVTLILFIILCLIFNIPNLSILVLIICIVSALLDEIGHESIPNLTENKFLNLFFEYRFVMKIIIFLLAVGGVFSLWVFVFFILFEVAYEMAGLVFDFLNLKNNKKGI